MLDCDFDSIGTVLTQHLFLHLCYPNLLLFPRLPYHSISQFSQFSLNLQARMTYSNESNPVPLIQLDAHGRQRGLRWRVRLVRYFFLIFLILSFFWRCSQSVFSPECRGTISLGRSDRSLWVCRRCMDLTLGIHHVPGSDTTSGWRLCCYSIT